MEQQKIVEEFLKARDWRQYHTPKELLLALVEEIGEFRNIIKWEQNEAKIRQKIKDNHEEIEDFFGDVLWELCSLGNYCDVNLSDALDKVIDKHKIRYPAGDVKGKHTNE
jgi:dCTP diphosphatase